VIKIEYVPMLQCGVKYSYKATYCWIIYVWLIGHMKLKFYVMKKSTVYAQSIVQKSV